MAKNHPKLIKYSLEEIEKISKKAESLGMKFASYVRFVSCKADVEVKCIKFTK